MSSIRGKWALITGATSGFGKATADLLARNGCNVIITGRTAEKLEALTNVLTEKYGVHVLSYCFDVRQLNMCVEMANDLNSREIVPDILINNAGLASGKNKIHEGLISDWETMIDTNVKGLLYVSKIVANWMIEHGHGHIINIGSIAGKEVYVNGNVYCASKHAVDALSKAMRIDLLPHGIKVTAVHPGAVETEFSIVRFKGDEQRAKKVYEGFDALSAEDIAETIWFAVSRPAHVNINELIVMPTAQANAGTIFRK